MQGLKVLVVVMGVLIVAGVAVLGTALVSRMSGGSMGSGSGGPVEVKLTEPAGSHITAASLAPDRMAITVVGGGAEDRVVLVDTKAGRVLGRVRLVP